MSYYDKYNPIGINETNEDRDFNSDFFENEYCPFNSGYKKLKLMIWELL